MKAERYVLVCLVLALSLLAQAGLSARADEQAGAVLTLSNDAYRLEVDPVTLSLHLMEKDTDQVFIGGAEADQVSGNAAWKGFLSSTLSIEYTQDNSNSPTRVDVQSAATEITREDDPSCLAFTVDFTELGERLRVVISLHEDGLSITVPGDSIEEYGNSQLCGVYLLPCFGATRLNEEGGYIFVPEAAGAIIEFTDGKGMGNTPYAKRIYGDNVGVDRSVSSKLNRPAEQITMPVYGMAYTDRQRAYLAVVQEGEMACELLAYPAGVITEYNWVGAHFVLRESYIRQTTRTMGLPARETNAYLRDMSVRFYMLRDEEASYAGMARRYRAILEEETALKTVSTSYRPRIDILGAEAERFLLWDQLVPMTDIDEAEAILTEANEKGLTPPLVNYRGWVSGGLSRALGSGSVSLERQLGSLSALSGLKKQVEEAGGAFSLEFDPVQANPNRMYNMRLDIVRSIGQTVAQVPTGKELYPNMYYLTPRRSGEILKDYKRTYEKSFPGMTVATLPDTLYSYYSAGQNYTRGDTEEAYEEVLASLEGMSLALKNPLAVYFRYMDAYLDMPLNCTSYAFISAEVPFLPMVLSGHVPYYSAWNNFDSNQRRQVLKLVEYGAFPAYLITSRPVQKLVNTNSSDVFTAQWQVIMDTVLSTDGELSALFSSIGERSMTDHAIPQKGVAVVSWGDDLKVIVNYNEGPVEVLGLRVDGMAYSIVEGGDGR